MSEREVISVRVQGRPLGRSFTDFQLQAIESYQRAVKAMGPRLVAIVEPVVLFDTTIRDLAASSGVGALLRHCPHQVTGALQVSLDVLADFYGMK